MTDMADEAGTATDDAEWALRILGRLADVAFVLGLDGRVDWRRELRRGATGVPDSAVVGQQMLNRTHPDEMGMVLAHFDDLVSGRKDRIEVDVRVRSARGDDTWTRNQVLAVRMSDGRIAGLARIVEDDIPIDLDEPEAPGFSIADVTPVGLAMVGLADRMFSTAFEHAPTGMALVGLDNRFLRVNPAFAEITGYPAAELLRLGFPAITHPDDLDEDISLVRQIIAGKIRSYRLEKRYLHKDGHQIWVELRVAGAYNQAGTLTHFISQITDITSRRYVEEQQRVTNAELAHRATHDPLTDLANRALLDEHLRLSIARVRRDSEQGAVVYCDLDGFKAINDAHGHVVGDRILVLTASRLNASIRETDLVARIGGDEFVVALSTADHPEGVTTVAERIHAAVCEPITDPEVDTLLVGASIGVTAISTDDDPMSAIHRADGLAYEAKRDGGGVRYR